MAKQKKFKAKPIVATTYRYKNGKLVGKKAVVTKDTSFKVITGRSIKRAKNDKRTHVKMNRRLDCVMRFTSDGVNITSYRRLR